jgi:glucose/arabinose dehydrogenase
MRAIAKASWLVVVTAGFASTGVSFGAEPAVLECRWATGPITIDGAADEAAWREAPVIDNFAAPWVVGEPRAAKTQTRARLLWDREHLYFFADLQDADLYAPLTEHDGKLWDNDVFELFFKPAETSPGYYEFQVNAAGAVLDMFIAERGKKPFEEMRSDGPFHLKTAVKLRGTLNKREDRDEGWSVEGRIPWTDFLRTGGRPVENEIWRFALCRYDYNRAWNEPDLSTSAPIKSKPSFHQHEEYAALKFLPQAASKDKPFGIERRVPLTTSRVVGSPDPPLPYRPRRAFADLKLNFPIAVDRVPAAKTLLLIAQEWSSGPATVYRIADDASVAEATPVLTVPEKGVAYGIAFHPKFAENGYLYLGWNGKLADQPEAKKQTIVTRYTWNHADQTLDPASTLHVIAWESDGHNGGDLEFGQDGMLYITSGDGTSDSDTNLRGQDLTHLTAKVLRIDVDHPQEGKAYRVPADNPFVGQEGIVPETWAYGLRNPWRIAVDEKTGHVWVTQNGQDLWEQVYLVRKGDNYGWSVYEGSHLFYAGRQQGPHPHVLPTAEHHHLEARSLTGGVVYHGSRLPELTGAYIYGDYSTGRIWGIKHDGTKVTLHKLLADTTFAISGFGLDSSGELLVADHRGGGEGAYYYLDPTPTDLPPSNFPKKLSETGLFTDVARHAMQRGVVPYSVNSPLWSDGAHKERFIAIPHQEGVDMRIDVSPNRGWNFPDRAVLVKSFALETTPGDPSSRRWIETRLLTRQEGEWVGYSYRWNDEQTDAELVAAEGTDMTYEVHVPRSRENPDGLKKQTWHYPSRTECMVCHSRAANWVLGLTTLQMNREHEYAIDAETDVPLGSKHAKRTDHQFRVLEHLGMIRAPYEADAVKFLKEDLAKAGLSTDEINKQVRELGKKSGQRESRESSLLAGPPERYPKLVDPYDTTAPLEARARSYLHANCSSCHVEAGGGNSQIDLEFTVSLDKAKLIDVVPLHHKFGLPDPRIIAPGHPERSVLLHRLIHRGPNSGQMPQLATNEVDQAAAALIEEWIRSLAKE